MEETIKEIKEKMINPFYEFPNPRSIELKCKDSDLILDLIKEYQKLKMQLEVEKIDNKYNQEEASEEMIPRYKIKAKIEELKKYQDKFDERNMLKDVLIKQKQIQVLQSLLEKE